MVGPCLGGWEEKVFLTGKRRFLEANSVQCALPSPCLASCRVGVETCRRATRVGSLGDPQSLYPDYRMELPDLKVLGLEDFPVWVPPGWQRMMEVEESLGSPDTPLHHTVGAEAGARAEHVAFVDVTCVSLDAGGGHKLAILDRRWQGISGSDSRWLEKGKETITTIISVALTKVYHLRWLRWMQRHLGQEQVLVHRQCWK